METQEKKQDEELTKEEKLLKFYEWKEKNIPPVKMYSFKWEEWEF